MECLSKLNILDKLSSHPQATLLRTLPVIPQVILPPGEALWQMSQVYGLSGCVGPLVDEQVVGFGKVSAAKLADELFFSFWRATSLGRRLSVRSQFTEATEMGLPSPGSACSRSAILGGSSCVAAGQVSKRIWGRSLCRAGRTWAMAPAWGGRGGW